MESLMIESPEISLRAGDKDRFGIDIILPANPEIPQDKGNPTAVLAMTDGYVTFWVSGKNVFEMKKRRRTALYLLTHTNLALSMFLEWIYFDRAYDLAQERSFADIVAGEAAPDLRFRRAGDMVSVHFDCGAAHRNGMVYRHSHIPESISIQLYQCVLLTIAEDLVAVLSQRAQSLGLADPWQKWLDGYEAEREAFLEYMAKAKAGLQGVS